jgi:hypothetical protein
MCVAAPLAAAADAIEAICTTNIFFNFSKNQKMRSASKHYQSKRYSLIPALLLSDTTPLAL